MRERPTREHTLMAVALVVAARGTCDRLQVGAVIALDDRPVSFGYNGAPPGLPHCDENRHGWLPVWDDLTPAERPLAGRPKDWIETQIAAHGCRNATHAEANALAFAARQGISTENATLYVTVAPCDVCARLLIAAGIREVIYREEYRDRRGLDLLSRALVACRHLQGHHSARRHG